MAILMRFAAMICLLGGLASDGRAIEWPIFRDSVYKPIGNSYGEYQSVAMMHSGIDIMAPAGTPIYAVKSGYVKAILTTSEFNDEYWRVVVGDSAGADSCDAYMYAHVDYSSITWLAGLEVGDTVEEGQYLGDVVLWTYNDFNHLHFSKIRHAGASWDNWENWIFVANPLDGLVGIADSQAPVIEFAQDNQKFAFCRNQTASYSPAGSPLSGDVDIISRVHDHINFDRYQVVPYEIAYSIDDGTWITSVRFSGSIKAYPDMETLIGVIYKDDAVCGTYWTYDSAQYCFSLTNTDGDSIIEYGDRLNAWRTPEYNNGLHTVYVRAGDRAGNTTLDSMTVSVENYATLQGTVLVSDQYPQPPAGSIVTVTAEGKSDTTDTSGHFIIASVGGGNQMISITRPGYATVDTVIMMNQDRQLEVIMYPGDYVPGDADLSGDVSLADAVYTINFVFKGGPAPIPAVSGDANCDSQLNLADAVYLINYVFKGGPPPGC